ncbi:MAG: hypothetical protein JO128_05055 [Alphaproteobacteria bacterium]|nr:hypothetical protein [Alphaproteobacteria bacterium]
MQAYHQPRLRKTPFGDLPAPSESRYVRADFVGSRRSEEPGRPSYEIFSLKPAIDGLGSADTAHKPARN